MLQSMKFGTVADSAQANMIARMAARRKIVPESSYADNCKKNSSSTYPNASKSNFVRGKMKSRVHGGCRTCHVWGAWTAIRPTPSGYGVTEIGATALCLRSGNDANSIAGSAD